MPELNKQIVSFTSFFSCSAYRFDRSFLSKCNLSSWSTKPVLNASCALPALQPGYSLRALTWWPRSCTPSALRHRSACMDWPSTWKWVFGTDDLRQEKKPFTSSFYKYSYAEAPSSNHRLTQDFQSFWKRSLWFGKNERLKTQSTAQH